MNTVFLKFALLAMIILNSLSLKSQVTTLDLGSKKTEDKIILKPEPYDSLKNWQNFERLAEYKRYIGLDIYLQLFSDNDNIGDKYFTIINVLYGDTIIKLLDKWSFKKMKQYEREVNCKNCPSGFLDIIPQYKRYSKMGQSYNPKVFFVLSSSASSDTSFCSLDLLKQFTLVPYFLKQKALYENKYIIYDDREENQVFDNCVLDVPDIKNNEVFENDKGEKVTQAKRIKILRGSKWLCTNVALLKKSQVYSKDHWSGLKYFSSEYELNPNAYTLFYILKGSNGETIAFESLKPLKGELKSIREDVGFCGLNDRDGFILENDYLKRKVESKLLAQQLIAKGKQKELIKKQNFEKRRADCLSKFGQVNGELIAKNKVNIGMSQEMCKYSWGSPLWIDKTTTVNGTHEIWHYWLGYNLYFFNGSLKRIDE